MKSYAGARAFSIPCGQCMSCRLAKAQDWSTRVHHEAARHADNCFVTLTFSEEFLPSDGSVRVRHIQLFMKRLRKRLGHARVRYFACGEYGERGYRPHYHLILFGYCPADLVPWRRSSSGFIVSRSAELETVWPYGHVEVGTVTTQSAGYVARYVTKKVTGDDAGDHYTRWHPVTGFPWSVCPEFLVMSRRPGIGDSWFAEFGDDAFPSDFLVIEGQRKPVPRFYKKRLDERHGPENAGEQEPLLTPGKLVTLDRKERAQKHTDEQTTRRLLTKRDSQLLRAARLQRELETDT